MKQMFVDYYYSWFFNRVKYIFILEWNHSGFDDVEHLSGTSIECQKGEKQQQQQSGWCLI